MIPTPEQIRRIYAGIDTRVGLKTDIQGWNSSNPIFARLIGQLRPKVIVEVGVWKGASILHMAAECKSRGLSTVLFGVDGWWGHAGEMIGEPTETPIPANWQEPSHYEQFLFNVKASGHDDCIIPVWQLTRWGANCLGRWGVNACLLYVDADHDEEGALRDFRIYWPTLRQGGVMFGDDFGDEWGVPAAVRRFSKEVGHGFSVEGGQWYFDPKR